MVSATFKLLKGPMFEVLAGKELKPFLVHARILSKSDTLKTIVDGIWKDSVDRKIELKDWDEETVGRCVEWLYSGDYTSPLPERPSPSTPSETADIQIVNANGNTSQVPRTQNRSQPNRDLTDPYKRPKSSLETFHAWTTDCPWGPEQLDFGPSLSAHAKIYCLADYLLLLDLQKLALCHFKNLIDFMDPLTQGSPAVNNIVAIVRYVYTNTSRPQTGKEPLQDCLSGFVASNAADLRIRRGMRCRG